MSILTPYKITIKTIPSIKTADYKHSTLSLNTNNYRNPHKNTEHKSRQGFVTNLKIKVKVANFQNRVRHLGDQ